LLMLGWVQDPRVIRAGIPGTGSCLRGGRGGLVGRGSVFLFALAIVEWFLACVACVAHVWSTVPAVECPTESVVA
jgi:hypothetical protein